MSALTYSIIGTGAVGGYYGACLHQAGLEVHFLAHSDYAHIRQHGLLLESKDRKPARLNVKVYNDVREMPPCDVVVVALKATQNGLLPQLLPPIMKSDGVVLMFQNGWDVEALAARIVGPERVMGGLCFLCSNKVGPGHIRHLDYGEIKLANYNADGKPGGITPRMQDIASDFQRAGLSLSLVEDLILTRWQKLVWNIPYNGLSVILNTTTDRIMADPATRALTEDIMQEVVQMAHAFDRTIDEGFIRKMIDDTERMEPYKTSMMLDYEAGRPMEIEAIYESPLNASRARGVDSPKTEMLCRLLRSLDTERRAP